MAGEQSSGLAAAGSRPCGLINMKNRCAIVVLGLLAASAAPLSADEYEWKDGKWVRLPAAVEGTAGGELSIVRKHLAEHRPKKALKAAKKFLKDYPDSPSREEAMLLAGQAQMDSGRYYQAYLWFEKLLTEYGGGRFSQRALRREFEIAEAFLGGRKRRLWGFIRISGQEDGLEILSRVAEHAPATQLAQKAMLRIADHYYSSARYAEAADAYEQFLKLFGKSDRAPYAMLQSARAVYATFRGVKFDDTPLVEAEHRFGTFARQYPRAAKKANVGQILREIAETHAEKLFESARFYERTARAKSAAFYYKQVMDKYPQSRWAAKARQALARLGGVEARAAETRPARTERPSSARQKGSEKK